ncbi:MAG: low molecular weight phosphotyrosine protein phosphatase [Propionibacteriaceae bacterium]|jgi:protein-tyrosine phosphatase|nr:low molecular weight phosphotyrosine protein phosphatase [Propionibacteriaceae bacterium]
MSHADAEPVRVVFVCWGNICRSPMAERVARGMAPGVGLDWVEFTSAALSDEEEGNPMDPPARRTLERAGYDAAGHRAHTITPAEILSADLVVGVEPYHVERLRRLAPAADHIVLLSDYDPAHLGQAIVDPWGGPPAAFQATLTRVEAAMPGLLAAVAEL